MISPRINAALYFIGGLLLLAIGLVVLVMESVSGWGSVPFLLPCSVLVLTLSFGTAFTLGGAYRIYTMRGKHDRKNR